MDLSEVAAVYAEERKSSYALLATNDPDADSLTAEVVPVPKASRRSSGARSWLRCCFTPRLAGDLDERGHLVVVGWGASTTALVRELFFHLAGNACCFVGI
jgi:hypothetical protein